MDPIHPIVPHTSSMPIQPALAPHSVRREQRRESDQQGGNAPHPDGERDTEFEDQLEDRLGDRLDDQFGDEPDDQFGDEPGDELDEEFEDSGEAWDGTERRGYSPHRRGWPSGVAGDSGTSSPPRLSD